VPDPLRVVLVSPRNPLNIGAAARAMSNFGFTELRLVNPYEVAFHEARSAVRSRYILEAARVFENLGAAVADCTLVVGTTAAGRRDLHLPLDRLEAGASMLKRELACSPAALVFGCEKFGLSNEDLSHCHWLMRIPTREEHGSMNLGQAVAICLYELRRGQEAAEHRFEPPQRASAEEYERMTALLLDLLGRSGYVHDRTSASTELKIRRLLRRLFIPASDTETWLGILRQILWKIKQSGSE
jgi:TrmH family RNA methyltransferase